MKYPTYYIYGLMVSLMLVQVEPASVGSSSNDFRQ